MSNSKKGETLNKSDLFELCEILNINKKEKQYITVLYKDKKDLEFQRLRYEKLFGNKVKLRFVKYYNT